MREAKALEGASGETLGRGHRRHQKYMAQKAKAVWEIDRHVLDRTNAINYSGKKERVWEILK